MPCFSLSLRVRSCQMTGLFPAGLPGTRWPWKFRKPAESRARAFGTSPEGRHKMIRKATLKIGVPALLVCMALNAYLAVDHFRQMRKMDALTFESSKMQITISGVLADLTDMETSQRGYLLTGDQSYLQPYTSAKERIGTDLANLRTQLAASEDWQDRFRFFPWRWCRVASTTGHPSEGIRADLFPYPSSPPEHQRW